MGYDNHPAPDGSTPLSISPDPLSDDQAGDEVVVTTRRGLARVALVGAEIGARFERDGIASDFLEWLLRPQPLFDGGTPIISCLDKDACTRAVLALGLGLPLDVKPEELDKCVLQS